jgi:hypothetical protein
MHLARNIGEKKPERLTACNAGNAAFATLLPDG